MKTIAVLAALLLLSGCAETMMNAACIRKYPPPCALDLACAATGGLLSPHQKWWTDPATQQAKQEACMQKGLAELRGEQ